MYRRVCAVFLIISIICISIPARALAAPQSPSQSATYIELTPLKYDAVSPFSDGLSAVYIGKINQKFWGSEYDGGKWGFVNSKGIEVVAPKYDSVYSFSEGMAAVGLDGKWGFIDITGAEIVPPKYDGVKPFTEGMAAVSYGVRPSSLYINIKWGFIDKSGIEVIPLIYNTVLPFSEGLAGVRKDYRVGFINQAGQEVIPLNLDFKLTEYSGISSFSNGMAAVDRDAIEEGYIDRTGKLIAAKEYTKAMPFEGGLARVSRDGKWGFINTAGVEVIPPGYDEVEIFVEERARVRRGAYYGFIDMTGVEVIPLKYENVLSFSEDRAGVLLDDKAGFIDRNGGVVIPLEYSSVESYTEGMAAVNKGFSVEWGSNFTDMRITGGKWGFIDKQGREVVPPKYDGVMRFSEGVAAVYEGGKCGFIDKSGKVVIPLIYDDVGSFTGGAAPVCINNKWGFVALTGSAGSGQTQAPVLARSSAATPEDEVKVILDGRYLKFDVKPRIINDRIMLPLRAIFEEMGASIVWDDATATVTAIKDNTVVVLTIGSLSPTINGNVVAIAQPAVIVDGRTLAPLRFVAEAFGGAVVWDEQTKTATITRDPASTQTKAPLYLFSTVKDFLDSPLSFLVFQRNATDIADPSDADVETLGTDNELIYRYKANDRTIDISNFSQAEKSALTGYIDSKLESNDNQVIQFANILKTFINQKKITVTVLYLDYYGNTIYSKSWSSD